MRTVYLHAKGVIFYKKKKKGWKHKGHTTDTDNDKEWGTINLKCHADIVKNRVQHMKFFFFLHE